MSKNKYKVLDPIDPLDAKSIGDHEKTNLLLNGYRPYQTEDGTIKWLTVEQRSYKLMQSSKQSLFSGLSFRLPKKKKHRRRRGSPVKKFIRSYVVFALLMTLVATAIILTLKYFYLIF
ncbi:MAG: hypothetical protein CVU48_02945 [Candidatus Cloacimonetes bacterium HGW-Cloacimonetes-1]|jgi:hypothetical protein|nr:MAG: hypothetical protein CVU48_02945 [Candidatus Cloacimonetes bacterium HGW-Cloacimonetes-1]